MYKVNRETKKLERVMESTFKELKCKERQDLQEWIASEPSVLGEDLLIIQKEFADWENTNERLDLLALDKDGNLVIIENKTDDTGRDVVWQAVKYASYCSTLRLDQIKDIYVQYLIKEGKQEDAKNSIMSFLEKDSWENVKLNQERSQRIILVAHNFRKEVLSAALWLRKFDINISCIQMKPLKYGDEIFLLPDQILPEKAIEEYTVKLANKAKEEQEQEKVMAKREKLRSEFWVRLIPKFNLKSDLFKNISYSNRLDHWLSAGAGMVSGVSYSFLICKDYCGVELTIANQDQAINKKIFDKLYECKDEIEGSLNEYNVSWERLDVARMSRIAVRDGQKSLYDKESWGKTIDYLVGLMQQFEKTFKNYISLVKDLK